MISPILPWARTTDHYANVDLCLGRPRRAARLRLRRGSRSFNSFSIRSGFTVTAQPPAVRAALIMWRIIAPMDTRSKFDDTEEN